MVYKGIGFAFGFSLFGDPVISRVITMLNEKFSTWIQMLEPKKYFFFGLRRHDTQLMCYSNILRGVPTNNQLTLTLLRIGEAHRSPIPPIPSSRATNTNDLEFQIDQIPLKASRDELLRAIQPSSMPNGQGDHSSSPNNTNANEGEKEKPKHRLLSKVITSLKGNTKAVVKTKLAADHLRSSPKARGHLGVLTKHKNLIYAGPAEFKARFDGKKGWLYITNEPRLFFTTEDARDQQGKIDVSDKSKILWSIALQDIHRLKRATAFMSKAAEMAAERWDDMELLGSLEVEDETEKTWRFTAIPERDELFNRLVALGNQRWENM
jgi:hypothetical protein